MTSSTNTSVTPSPARLEPTLTVRDLHTYFRTADGLVRAVSGSSFDLFPGEMLGIVGPSGSGKSALARSVLGVVHGHPGVVRGRILFRGRDLLDGLESVCRVQAAGGQLCVEKDVGRWKKMLRQNYPTLVRTHMAAIFQHPEMALDPMRTVGAQLRSATREMSEVRKGNRSAANAQAWLPRVGLLPVTAFANRYPFEMSGGECQRAALACAAAALPDLLVADEPTSQLDSFAEEEIMSLLKDMVTNSSMAILVISHRIDVMVRHCDRLIALLEGRVVEDGDPREVAARLGWTP